MSPPLFNSYNFLLLLRGILFYGISLRGILLSLLLLLFPRLFQIFTRNTHSREKKKEKREEWR